MDERVPPEKNPGHLLGKTHQTITPRDMGHLVHKYSCQPIALHFADNVVRQKNHGGPHPKSHRNRDALRREYARRNGKSHHSGRLADNP